jgi:hypothetical protein
VAGGGNEWWRSGFSPAKSFQKLRNGGKRKNVAKWREERYNTIYPLPIHSAVRAVAVDDHERRLPPIQRRRSIHYYLSTPLLTLPPPNKHFIIL